MKSVLVDCDFCSKKFERFAGRYNEAIKMGWLQFCSLECQRLSKQKAKVVSKCKTCGSEIVRLESKIEPSGNIFCSSHCSIKYSNSHRITKLTLAKRKRQFDKPICANPRCQRQIGIDNKTYCSTKCKLEAIQIIDVDFVIKEINNLVDKLGRIPIKYEVPALYSRTRRTFGSWNKAIKIAGFEPNPVMFSRKYTANDGHRCDSLSEKIVDDWLFARKIKHEVKVKYPWGGGMTADFKVGEHWIELFGLTGQLKSYDRLMRIKREKAQEYRLRLISLYLSDLFPVNHLADKLSILQI